MITRYRAWMDGQGLDDLDPSIIIRDIVESVPKIKTNTASIMGRSGIYMISRYRETLTVTIQVEIHEYSTQRRKAVAEKIAAWAKDGILAISDRPGQVLRVVCDKDPIIASAMKWTGVIQISFVAYDMPYWSEEYPVMASGTGKELALSLAPPGNAEECDLDVSITAGGSVREIQIDTPLSVMKLRELAMKKNDVLTVGHDDKGILGIHINGQSAMGKRTVDSSDDLLIRPGSGSTIKITADGPVSAFASARGVWL